jgi:hypothetical protein
MSTQAIAPTPSTIDPNDPRLISDVAVYDAWCPVDGSGPIIQISDRYTFLKDFTQQLVLALWDKDHSETARRLANCGLRGSVYKVCKKGKRARAHRHTCHCWICDFCGQAKNLLYTWLRTRRYEVRHEAQRGLEVTGPLNAGIASIAFLLSQWLRKKHGIDSLRRKEVEARPTVDHIRMVLHTEHVPYREALEYLRRVTHDEPGWSLRLHHESSPTLVLRWMFESTASVLECCAATRARLYDRYYHHHLLKVSGEFYAPVKDPRSIDAEEESEVDGVALPQSTCNCGECDGVMVTIPWNQRTVESVERIEEQYEHVDWSSSYNPFRVIRMEGITYSSMPKRERLAETAAPTPSPPS